MDNSCLEFFLRYPGFKTKAITLSYDDGKVQDKKMIEILNHYGIKATFNLNSGLMGDNAKHINAEEIKDLYAGHEVACHSYSHPFFENNLVVTGGAAHQIVADRNFLENILKKPIQGFAYPYGYVSSEKLLDVLNNCGIRYARTTVSTHNFDLPKNPLLWNPTCHHSDEFLNEITEKFFVPDDIAHPWRIRLKLLYIWGHSYEFDGNWKDLEKICGLLSGHNEVWYATNGEIIDYLLAYNQIRCSVNGKFIYNPTDTNIYIVVKNKELIIKSGETVTLE